MHSDDHVHSNSWSHGPRVWVCSAVAGCVLGWIASRLLPGQVGDHGPIVEPWMVTPFAVMLLSIAVMPFISLRWWHRHYPDFAFLLGGFIAAYYLSAFSGAKGGGGGHGAGGGGGGSILHAVEEYYAFIGLVGSLYVVSGAILVDLRGKATPLRNGMLLLVGAVIANLVGTTGASALLIRPFLRMNERRAGGGGGGVKALQVVMFIFIVSNCGGSLTPIGDPPLYIGFIKGIPFMWTLEHLWNDWLLVVLPLVAIYVGIDAWLFRARPGQTISEPAVAEKLSLRLTGRLGMIGLALVLFGVFVDPMLNRLAGFHGFPVGATFQMIVATVVYLKAPKDILSANEFNFEPIKEVALLFVGIFLTMVPALGLMAARGKGLGLDGPTSYYFATGGLSAVLDNAPTYLNFLQLAVAPDPISKDGLLALIAKPDGLALVKAISTGAVFFGAMTYIGNGPNFMVRAIAESAGVKMPSFFGYVGWAVLILLPVLMMHWFVLIR